MTTYTAISNTTAEKDKPLTQSLVRALRDNPLAIAEGDVTAPKVQPQALRWAGFRASRGSGVQNIDGIGNSSGVVAFPSEAYDIVSGYNTTTYRYTPPIAGIYMINTQLVRGNSSGTRLDLWIRKNGTRIQGGHVVYSTGVDWLSVSGLVQMNGTTDYLDVEFAFVGGGSGVCDAANTIFTANLLSYL